MNRRERIEADIRDTFRVHKFSGGACNPGRNECDWTGTPEAHIAHLTSQIVDRLTRYLR